MTETIVAEIAHRCGYVQRVSLVPDTEFLLDAWAAADCPDCPRVSANSHPAPTAAQLTRALRDLLEFLDDHCNDCCSAPYSAQMREASADARWLLDVPEEGS